MIIRPIEANDYQALLTMAIESGHGFTSLPVHEQLLKQRIQSSIQAIHANIKQAGDQSYLFVLEQETNTDNQKEIIGVCGIEAAVGLTAPFYHYRLGKVVRSSPELNIYNTVETLSLCNDYTGATELCSLFLLPQFRNKNAGKLLSRCRYLFMSEFPERFADTVIAELRGVSDETGRSPFWDWLEAHFFSLDFPTADYLTGIGNKVFIAELMPKYPIYTKLLSKAAQQSIGKVHKLTLPALKLLEREGFEQRGYVDIFDAGPTVEAKLNNIRSIQAAKRYTIVSTDFMSEAGKKLDKANCIVANTKLADFRATIGCELKIISADKISISANLAQALKVTVGDNVRLLPC